MSLHIGISGWTYAPWRGRFYPPKLPQKQELGYASRQVNSIEINGSFYSLQTPTSYQKWREATPDDFVFSLKAPRYITHLKRLKNVEAPLANFFASGVLALNQKLGPILWQLPPTLQFDPALLEVFFAALPRDHEEAARLAKKHDDKVKQPYLAVAEDRPIRHAMEVRHESFACADFIDLLRRWNVALVVAETGGKWPLVEEVTAKDLVYVRLHGDQAIYESGYSPAALKEWGRKIRAWAAGKEPRGARKVKGARRSAPSRPRDVFVYFDNDVKVRAPADAMALARLLKVGPAEADSAAGRTWDFGDETPRSSWPAVRRRRRRTKKS